MLNKIFNYLKAKHLPASLSFKNRLYLERDIKSRRIVANFGATFRNSKWSDYSLTNVNLKHKASFLNFIKGLVIFFVLTSHLYSYYIYSNVWLIHTLLSYVSSMANFLYVWYLYAYLVVPLLFKHFTRYIWGLFFKNTFFKKEPDSSVIYNSNSSQSLSCPTNSKIYSNSDKLNSSLAKTLYTAVRHLNIISSTTPNFNKAFDLTNTPTSLSLTYSPININSSILNSNFTDNKLLIINNPLTNSKFGSFYLTSSDWHYISSTLMNSLNRSDLTSSSISNQLANVKTLRWTYRYNMLHRHVLNGSTQLTSTKKLLSSGFLDSTSSTKNLWFSDNYSDLSNKSSSNYLSILYPSLYNSSPTSFSGSTESSEALNKLLLVNSYETSFYFYLKRIFTFTNLNSQEIQSSKKLHISLDSIEDNIAYNSNSLLKLTLSKSLYLTNGLLNPINKSLAINNLVKKSTSVNFTKDLVVLNWEWDLLLNEQLESMVNIVNSLPSSNGLFYRFSNTTSLLNYLPDTTLEFTPITSDSNIIQSFTPYKISLSNLDLTLLNDVILFSLINKQ